jgi:hypothetical protein
MFWPHVPEGSMPRLVHIAAATAALAAAAPALAADYSMYPELRPSYPDQWAYTEDNPLRFEVGLRYWYSLGSHRMTTGSGDDYSADDTSHILEGHFRIDDLSTSTYVKGEAGFAAIINGTYETPSSGGPQEMQGGHIGYAGADFGYMPFGTETLRLGALVGYQYMNDSPDMDGSMSTGNIEFHTLRLGLVGKADIADRVDFNVEAAAIPVSYVSGTYAADGLNDTLTGYLYGAAGEAMIGVHPTDHLTVRAGGRVSYLTGPAEFASGGTPESVQSISYLRYGALLELTGRF